MSTCDQSQRVSLVSSFLRERKKTHLRIPILIKENDGRGGGEVDSESSSSRRNEKDLMSRTRLLCRIMSIFRS